MKTKQIDKLFLELSQFTSVETEKEKKLRESHACLLNVCEEFLRAVKHSSDPSMKRHTYEQDAIEKMGRIVNNIRNSTGM